MRRPEEPVPINVPLGVTCDISPIKGWRCPICIISACSNHLPTHYRHDFENCYMSVPLIILELIIMVSDRTMFKFLGTVLDRIVMMALTNIYNGYCVQYMPSIGGILTMYQSRGYQKHFLWCNGLTWWAAQWLLLIPTNCAPPLPQLYSLPNSKGDL